MATNVTTSNDKAKQRKQERFELGLDEKRAVSIPKMPAWKINALNQIGEDTLNQVLNKLEDTNRVMVIRPTGFGKSFMLAGLTSCGRFKKCLYIYPQDVIKTDMVDTYGALGEDNRANTLINTTFITYKRLGDLARSLGMSVNKADINEDYTTYTEDEDSLDINEEDNIVLDKLTIRRLTYENEVYDASTLNWYNKIVKNKRDRVRNYKKQIEKIKLTKTEAEADLNELYEKKSKAVVKKNNLLAIINEAEHNIEILENKISKLSAKKSDNSINETNIPISSKDDLRNWLSTFDIIIADEAHKTGAPSFISLWQEVLRDLVVNKSAGHTIKLVGATATPYRLDGKSLEDYIFGENSRLRKIDINDCIKANNWSTLGIDLDKILNDDDVINEGTTRDYLESRGLFKKIDYIYTIKDLNTFADDVIEYLNKQRQEGSKLTEDTKEKMVRTVISDRAREIREERDFCKLSNEELKTYRNESSKTANEIRRMIIKGMNDKQKQYALDRCKAFKNEDTKNIFTKMIRYQLTSEDIQHLIYELKNNRNTDVALLNMITREENYLKPDEENYIRKKINEAPNLQQLLHYSIQEERNTYGLKYMKFIIFFSSASALNSYISRGRDSKTMLGACFSKAFPGYYVYEAALHTGKGTQGVEKITPGDLDSLKPTDRVIDLIYCVDQLNMGYHVENITGVILLRNTESASVYNQQIGRCCSVRAENNTVMIDIIDKKSIDDIIKQVYDSYDYQGLSEDGKQKDLRHLLDPECINICDFNRTLIEIINNMKDMRFNDREIVRFLHFERKAPVDVIVHMTDLDERLVRELLEELSIEKTQVDIARQV